MTIDTIKTRIENGQKKLVKLEAKMARIRKAQASNWEDNPYYYNENDIKWTQRDIDDQRASIEKYQKMLGEETDKASSRNVPVLVAFLNMWKDNAKNWYNDKRTGKARISFLKKVKDANKKYRDLYDHQFDSIHEVEKQVCAKMDWNFEEMQYKDALYNNPMVAAERERVFNKIEILRQKYYDIRDEYNSEYAEIEDMEQKAYNDVAVAKLKKLEAEYKSRKQKWVPWDHHVELTKPQKNKAWDEYLEKLLDKEWNRKYDKLLNDVIRITGTIDDASGLRINEKGDLDGFVSGKKGTARVNTFGAGGYNIQCFHYRTKVTRVK